MIKGCKIINPLSINRLYSFFQKKFEKGYFFKGESHDFYEVVCVLSGNVGITAGRNVFTLRAGEMTFHPPGEFHAIWDEGESAPEVIIFSFSASTFPNPRGKIFSLSEEEIQKISTIRKKITQCIGEHMKSILPGEEMRAALTVKETECFLISIFGENVGYSAKSTAQSTNVFSNILYVMEKNISSSLSVSDIANLCGISIPTLEKTVSKYLGYGAMAHFNTLKLQRAHTLLLSGMSVKEVSLSLGFLNQNYFSARFKKYYGYAPSRVRSLNT